jgi:hypothetical protein
MATYKTRKPASVKSHNRVLKTKYGTKTVRVTSSRRKGGIVKRK